MDGLMGWMCACLIDCRACFGEIGAGPSVFVPSEAEPQACGCSCMFACIRVCLHVADTHM